MNVVAAIEQQAIIINGGDSDYAPLLDLVGDKRFVLLGEASHGTHEFYVERAKITQKLIIEKGFNAIAIEGDWPDAYRVNQYVTHQGRDQNANEALSGFTRFPSWMWRNSVIVEFVDWLHNHNQNTRSPNSEISFYGLDLYSLFTSIDEVIRYLRKYYPALAEQAKERYACFDRFGRDSQRYGYAVGLGGESPSCEDEVVNQFLELNRLKSDTLTEYLFSAQQNANLVKNAEHYYRSMFSSAVSSWNLRDKHMMQTLVEVDRYTSNKNSKPAKVIVWAHNSHLGDARATEMAVRGELNLGQLVRQHYADEVFLLGFSTYHGTVTASSDWGDPAEAKSVLPALKGSYEALMHQSALSKFILPLKKNIELIAPLSEERLQRAIGVIYRPETERQSHYLYANLPRQFDALIHIDKTSAVRPLDIGQYWQSGEAPETFPVGI